MKKKECPSCAMDVDEKSEQCPICGYEFGQAPGKEWVKWLALLLLLVILIFWIF